MWPRDQQISAGTRGQNCRLWEGWGPGGRQAHGAGATIPPTLCPFLPLSWSPCCYGNKKPSTDTELREGLSPHRIVLHLFPHLLVHVVKPNRPLHAQGLALSHTAGAHSPRGGKPERKAV